MKSLVVFGLILLISVLGPQHNLPSRYDALWALGALVLVAYLLQQAVGYLRLPPLTGWVGAGLLLGASGLNLLQAEELSALYLVQVLMALWVGFQVGLHFYWPRGLGWKGPLLLGLITFITLIAIAAGLSWIAELPWWLALLFGSLASLWGLFAFLPNPARRGAVVLGALGLGFSLLFLSAVLALLWAHGFLPSRSLSSIARLWLSLLGGALVTECLQRLGLFAPRGPGLAAGLFAAFFISALLVAHWQLYALPYGFAAGLALVHQRLSARRLRFFLRSLSPMAFMIFFALLGATLDLGIFRTPAGGLLEILLVQVALLTLVRGLGPALYYPSLFPNPQARKRIGWFLLPRGALLFELLYHPQQGLLGLLTGDRGRLLHQVAMADILISLLFFSTLSLAVQHLTLGRVHVQAPAT